MEEEVFNSSDFEDELLAAEYIVPINPNAGAAKSKRTLNHALEHRKRSKIAVKYQTPVFGAPSTQAKQ
jgi:hypothetical protein